MWFRGVIAMQGSSMLRIREIGDANAAKAYYRQSDYYLEVPGEWLGKGAARLHLVGEARQADFDALCDNLNPATGKSLTALTVEGRRVGWDFNFNSSKSVGLAREIVGAIDAGEGQRIEDAHREAVAFAVAHIEDDMACRVRADGKDEDRITGNLIGFRVTHRTTRPNEDDKKPDPELHDHVVVMNATFDDVEGKVKAGQIGSIKHDAPYYEAIYHNRLAGNLRDLGYGVRRVGKGFEIEGVSGELVERFSRRSAAIEQKAAELGITSAAGKDQLGATTRLGKDESLRDDLSAYWLGKLSPEELEGFRHLKGQPGYGSDAERSVAYAIAHEFERKSVVDARRLYETAIRHGFGSVEPHEIEREARRQGLLVKDGEATTRAVLDQESRLIAYGRGGRGSWKPLAAENRDPLDGLSAEQKAAVRHVWQSPDGVIMIRGGAGTGKTRMMTQAVAGIACPVVVLAPSAQASRGVLVEEGFADADTVASFLEKPELREQARRGVVWIDEAGLLSTRQLDQLFAHAHELGARVVLQGDKRQHAAVERSATLQVLEDYAGLPVAELTEVRRQTHGEYKQAVSAIARGDVLGGYDIIDGLGWIEQTPAFDHNKPLVDAYLEAVTARQSVLVVAPSHKEIYEITGEIRDRLKEKGLIGTDERTFATLKPLGWTTAERGEIAHRATGGEVVQFVRNSGIHRAGARVAAATLAGEAVKPEHFAVYQPGEIALAEGDTIRVTANGRDKTGKHKLNNGALYQVAGFDRSGDIRLSNGWTLAKDFRHLTHGLAVTSHASQGKTVDRVLIAMGHESKPVISREQFYVSVSRARQQATVFTDLSPVALRDVIQRGDARISATELMGQASASPPEAMPGLEPRHLLQAFVAQVVETYRRLRMKAQETFADFAPEQEISYER